MRDDLDTRGSARRYRLALVLGLILTCAAAVLLLDRGDVRPGVDPAGSRGTTSLSTSEIAATASAEPSSRTAPSTDEPKGQAQAEGDRPPAFIQDPTHPRLWVRNPAAFWYRNEARLALVREGIPEQLDAALARRPQGETVLTDADRRLLRSIDPELSGGISADDLEGLPAADSFAVLEFLRRAEEHERDIPGGDVAKLAPINAYVLSGQVSDQPLYYPLAVVLQNLGYSHSSDRVSPGALARLKEIRRASLMSLAPVSDQLEARKDAILTSMSLRLGFMDLTTDDDCAAIWPEALPYLQRRRQIEAEFIEAIRRTMAATGQ